MPVQGGGTLWLSVKVNAGRLRGGEPRAPVSVNNLQALGYRAKFRYSEIL